MHWPCLCLSEHLVDEAHLLQTCIHIVTAYPYYPDVPMLVEAIALETPGEVPAAVILDVHSLPQISAAS